jgi:peptidoglycan/xylan/chitin deacetylase (PgdA/CDA1 family)
MDELLAWGGVESAGRADRRCLTVDEVCALARGHFIEVGAHTVTHPSLSTLPMDSQREEIRESKAQLEEIVDCAVTSFAYPYGKRSDYTSETVGLVEEAGFTGACSNIGGLVCNASDRFQLPRFHVQDWDGEEFSRQLSRWFDGRQ